MRYLALACDYDGTLAHHGRVDAATNAALERLRASGRKLLLVTGRELDDLLVVFPQANLFSRIIAENGAVVYEPETRELHTFGDGPPPQFIRELERRGVAPLSVGRVIVATWEPQDAVVLQTIRNLGLELQVVFNKGAVMVLPSGVNKATGLRQALADLHLSPHNVVGIGDAENDHAFLTACECSVAVANALDSVKTRVDLVTAADHGAGVAELIDRLIESDLEELAPRLVRHHIVLGHALSGVDLGMAPYNGVLLVAGPSGSGKTTVTTALLEQMCKCKYQFCVIDPEGDYYEFPEAVALRGADRRALAEEASKAIARPSENVVVSLVDLPLDERPDVLQQLLPELLELRASAARPHWIVIDEAHHLLPSESQVSKITMPGRLYSTVLVTVHPDHVSRDVLALVDILIVAGRNAQDTVDAFCRGRGQPPIRLPAGDDGNANLLWFLRLGEAPVQFKSLEPVSDRRRHRRKYAEGELGEDRSFYFRGPAGRLNLRAQNLELFLQLADGVDDETWEHHLRRHDFSRWFTTMIKDDLLAREAADIESQTQLSPRDSRARIREAIERRYTSPA